MQLLSVIPNRSVYWYVSFIWALKESGQKDLAMLFDKIICEKMETYTLNEVIRSHSRCSCDSREYDHALYREFFQ